MSHVAHTIGKVFSGIGHIVKKIWKPLAIAAAVYFTGGAALGAMGAMSAGGSLLGGAAAGLGAAADIGAGGILGAYGAGAGLAGAGADALAGAGVGALETAGDAGVSSIGAGAGTDAVTAAMSSGEGYYGGLSGGLGETGASMSDIYSSGVAAGGIPATGGASGLWGASLSTAKGLLGIPGIGQGIMGLIGGYQQAQMFNKGLAWQEAHAPGQIAGGVKNAFGGFDLPSNLQQTPTGAPAGSAPRSPMATYNPPGGTPLPMPAPAYTPGMNDPYATTAMYPGYGLPGYGVQGMNQQPGLLAPHMIPFMESPYG